MGEIGNDIVYPGAFAIEGCFIYLFFLTFTRDSELTGFLKPCVCVPVLGRGMILVRDSLPQPFLFHLLVVSLSLPPNIYYIVPLKTKWYSVLTFLYTQGKYISLCAQFQKQSQGVIEKG